MKLQQTFQHLITSTQKKTDSDGVRKLDFLIIGFQHYKKV